MADGIYSIDYYLQVLSPYDPTTHENRCFAPHLASCRLWRTYLFFPNKKSPSRAGSRRNTVVPESRFGTAP